MSLRAALLLAVVAVAHAETVPADLAADGWRAFTFAGLRPNRFIGHDDGTIEVVSDDSASALYRPLDVDFAAAPCLAWQWRVDEAMPPTDLRRRGRDDRPIALYVAYPYDPAHASFWESVVRAFVELFHGADAPGRIVAYAWGGFGARGQVQRSPYLQAAGGFVLLRPGRDQPDGVWLDEMVDLEADYERVFGDPANPPTQLALFADSDDTDSRSRAFVRAIRFTAACRAPP